VEVARNAVNVVFRIDSYPDDNDPEKKVCNFVGGEASPLLANLSLHYVFDLWAAQWRRRHARGEVIIVRYCDGTPVQA
jgi:hypothetical protein